MDTDKASEKNDPHHPCIVTIHIDQKPYESPNPTSGEGLYILGNVKQGLILYRKVEGNRETLAIADGPQTILLEKGEHFFSGEPREVTIIVGGTPHEWRKSKITYAEVVTLFDPTYLQHPEITYSVTYKRGHDHKPEGILSPGASVKVKDGMVFNVSATNQS